VTRSTADLPSALEAVEGLAAKMSEVARTAVFLDYDGTLTPIVGSPEQARLSDEMRATLLRLVERCDVAVISGRDLEDVRSLIGVDALYYAGSHGYEAVGPGGAHWLLGRGEEHLPLLDHAETALHERLDGIDGVLIERKRFSVAVHFRLAAPEAEETVSDAVDAVVSRHGGLRRSEGKKVIEVQPDVDWHKGKAVEWLAGHMGLDPGDSLIVFVGDDLTDENAFESLQGKGVGVVVRDPSPRESYADLALESPSEVRDFLEKLIITG